MPAYANPAGCANAASYGRELERLACFIAQTIPVDDQHFLLLFGTLQIRAHVLAASLHGDPAEI